VESWPEVGPVEEEGRVRLRYHPEGVQKREADEEKDKSEMRTRSLLPRRVGKGVSETAQPFPTEGGSRNSQYGEAGQKSIRRGS